MGEIEYRATPAGRPTLCFPNFETGTVVHNGQRGYQEEATKRFASAENVAAEQLVQLKSRLKTASTEQFWSLLMEGVTQIAGSQYGFVARRILANDDKVAVEMPRLGEVGSCLLGVAFYYNNGHGIVNMHRDYQYAAHSTPCAHMGHDKVFVIPERLNELIPENANRLPFPAEAYMGVPLFEEGKCFAHFGMAWSAEGAAARSLSWSYLEMVHHALEDLVVDRLLEGDGFVKPGAKAAALPSPVSQPQRRDHVIPSDSVSASQNLKPYARSLSHELRTPMQGVVGMLDMMHATVQEAVEDHSDTQVGDVLQVLRENIEVVQDSSRRAIEAADNVVHAYDMNMEIPDTPVPAMEDGEQPEGSPIRTRRLTGGSVGSVFPESNEFSFQGPGKKRRRSNSTDWTIGSAWKYRAVDSESPMPSPRQASALCRRECAKQAVRESERLTRAAARGNGEVSTPQPQHRQYTPETDPAPTPGLRHTRLRELLHHIISESLRVGGRPDYAIANDTEHGETIEVRSRSSNGEVKSKLIEWSVDPAVPETLLVDERDLAKLVSCVFLNALKFTERGKITLTATLSPKARSVSINIADTGPGIPQAFLPNLFKPFSQEDDSLTRQKDGLGLGLLVAKGLVRKIGGDLTCIRSDTSGPDRGSEFEIRLPVVSPDAGSHPGTPLARTPTPSIPNYSPPRDSPRYRDSPQPIHDANGPRSNPRPTDPSSPDAPPAQLVAPLVQSSLSRTNSRRNSTDKTTKAKKPTFNKRLAERYPLRFLVAEDNKINRRLLVSMLRKMGYTDVCEAYDGAEAVRQMSIDRGAERPITIVLMDLWMPSMDGYEATRRILNMPKHVAEDGSPKITILAVTADVTAEALERAVQVGMEGFMTKPYKLLDLERLIIDYCSKMVTP
ncbi:MAG: Class II abasic (AP) endonuclease [Chaenotheca gracillima]|nr:MAG: Class II abasic (AP) endonuclease [Chaenotheca gracillima]